MWVPLTPLDFYRRSRRLFAGKTAVVDEERRLSFGQLAERIERLAGALRAAGLRPKEAVSFLAPNASALLEGFYGVPLAGGVLHPVNPRREALQIAELLNDAGSRMLFLHGSQASLVAEILGNLKAVEQLVVFEGEPAGLGFPAMDYETLLSRAAPYAPDLTVLDENAPAALFHTSGGASKPRGVVLSHRALALHALYAVIAMGLREEDVSLCSVPFAYMNGGGNPQVNLAVGATSILTRRNDPETLLGLIAREKVTVWITAPFVLSRLLQAPALAGAKVDSLRLVLVGGAPLAEGAVAEAEEKLGARCLAVYGLTETAPFVSAAVAKSTLAPEKRRAVQATAGLPVLGVEIQVVDQTGREVTADGQSPGEIVVRGNNVMTAYHHDPESTQRALRGGWLHTEDLATVDAEGYLRIRERTQDVVLVDGQQVAAREIEAVLAGHPDVVECAVISTASPGRGEVPVGLVVLRAGARVTEQELKDYAGLRLSIFKVPQRIEFLNSLPKSEAGEILKSDLKTLYA